MTTRSKEAAAHNAYVSAEAELRRVARHAASLLADHPEGLQHRVERAAEMLEEALGAMRKAERAINAHFDEGCESLGMATISARLDREEAARNR